MTPNLPSWLVYLGVAAIVVYFVDKGQTLVRYIMNRPAAPAVAPTPAPAK